MDTEDTQVRQPGFDEPIPMAPVAPGVVDLIHLYNQYAQQVRVVEGFQRAVVCRSVATAGVGLIPDAHVG